MNPDAVLHVFTTFMGLPPSSADAPLCGAVLTAAYDGKGKPHCPACTRAFRKQRRRVKAQQNPGG
jgi:hypothetical protein